MADVIPVVPAKPPWQSKTLWVALVIAVLGFFPSVQDIVKASPEIVGLVLGGAFSLLRLISKGKIAIE